MIQAYLHTAPSGRQYVGIASQGWRARWRSHVFDARRGSDLPLHAAIRKYGASAFSHEVLLECATRVDAEEAERFYISALGTKTPAGYNATDGGEGVPGVVVDRPRKPRPPVSEATRARMRAAQLGRKRGPHSAEHRARLSAAHTGKPVSATTRDKLRDFNLGRKHSAETRARMAESQRAAHARRRASGGAP